jgi:hypothetical protein
MTTARESGSEADLQSAEQFGRGAGFLPKDVEGIGSLSAALEKRLFDAQDAAVAADRQVAQAAALSSDFERLTAGGTVVSMAEFIKRVTGTADEASELRRQFNEVRLSRALKNLPPGPATDKDVEQAFKGVPPENAPPEQVQSFLRGVEKMSALDAEFNRFKANYISKKKTATGMLEAWDLKMEIGDSPALESFGEEVEEAPQAAPAQPATSGVKFLGFE